MMTEYIPDGDVVRMDLRDRTEVQRPRGFEPDEVGDGLARLTEAYDAIVRQGGVYFPVAYEFVRELGRGRQGQVFLARRHGARGCVTEHAIKIFDPRLYESAEEYWTDMGRIARQLSLLQRVQTPTSVARHAYEETRGIGCLQMDAIDGLDVRRLLSPSHLELARSRSSDEEWKRFTTAIFRVDGDRVSLQPGIVIYIMRRVLRSLERLHGMGFLHSDIKPGNIMIDRLGSVKVIDFGRALRVGEAPAFLLGSPMYMAPEQHQRETGTPRSDIYSLGLVGIEMLRGELLLEMEHIDERVLLSTKQALDAALLNLLPEHVRGNHALVSSLRRMTALAPQERYASAREADVGDAGLRVIDKQLVVADLDSEYARDLADYLKKLVDPGSGRIELPSIFGPSSSFTG
ncbi:MAG: serine/threonine protein kinase [Verrucomicrobia bacterium]|jgi:eukaryotic-like serine/threonine-protein kinase|nr:serine/threonine protein kinase [Verrucomicrobiota bacterium]